MAKHVTLPERQKKHKFKVSEFLKHWYLVFLCLCILFPFFLMLSMSVKDQEQIIFDFFKISPPFHFENYTTAFGYVAPLILNSVFMAVSTAFLSVFVATLAGYAFGKLRFPFKRALFGVLFAQMLIPGILNLIPSFTLAMHMGILDTPWPVILFGIGTCQPFWVLVMRTFMEQQPIELFEAMRIDGASELNIFFKLAFPLLRPMVTLMGINVFISVWNDYIWPLVTIQTYEKRPLTVGLAYLTAAYPSEYGMLTAGYTIAAIPLLILFFLSMKQFIEGLTAGAVKL